MLEVFALGFGHSCSHLFIILMRVFNRTRYTQLVKVFVRDLARIHLLTQHVNHVVKTELTKPLRVFDIIYTR